MEKLTQSATRRSPTASSPRPLISLLRDFRLYQLFRALVSDQVSKLNIPGALYFTYLYEGNEVVAHQKEIDAVVASIGAAIANPRLRATPTVLRGQIGQTTLVVSPKAKQALLGEVAALLANIGPGDLQFLPGPVGEASRG
jgi:hypothetical protein